MVVDEHPDVETIQAGSRDEAVAKALERTHGQRGWAVLPADDPVMATRGFLIFRYLDARGTVLTDEDRPWPEEGIQAEELIIEWPLFDKPLEPLVNNVSSAQELLDFAKHYPDAVECSDPRRLLLGFAHYDPAQGRALICQTKLSQVKKTPESTRDVFLELRAAKVKEADVRRDVSQKEAVALGAAITNRAA